MDFRLRTRVVLLGAGLAILPMPTIACADTTPGQRFTGIWSGTWPNHGPLTIKVRGVSATAANVDYTRTEDNGRNTTEPTTTARIKGDTLSFGAITMTLTSPTTASLFGAFPRQPLTTTVTKTSAP